ncbi:flagellar biosynthetic protein FliO [Methylomonas sp. AM2-LC]|uniref:flagellar biosynthetic protein FliO n=1 Tax=Methylomonas sp. AM2-LC TaxID=3153301 RepID=UPI00326334DC
MCINRLLLFLGGLALTLTCHAEETVPQPQLTGKIVSSIDVWQCLLALLLVLGIFLVCAWLLRKSGSLALLNRGQLSIVAGLPLGMREKLVLVKVGDKQLLLGVTASRIDKLLELEGEQRLFQNQTSDTESSIFQKKLMQFMQSNRHE